MNIDPIVESSLKTAHGISELGIFVVIAGIMLVMFIILFLSQFLTTRNTNKKMVESQTITEQQNARIIQQNDRIILQNETSQNQNQLMQELMSRIANTNTLESLIEQTKENSYRIIRKSFADNLLDLLSGATDIIKNNHIDDKEKTHRKIYNVVDIAHKNRVLFLNNYKYKGTKLGDFANSKEWIDRKVEILKCHIYSSERDPLTLVRELRLAYDTFGYELNL